MNVTLINALLSKKQQTLANVVRLINVDVFSNGL